MMIDEGESKEGKHLPWAEGLPTRPDVDALLATFPPDTLKIGDRITDEQVFAVIGKCDRTRFRTVYSAWIRRLEADHRIVVKREKSVGFFVPTVAEVLGDTHPTLEHIGRSARKQIRKLAVIKPAEGIEADTRDHHGRLLGAMRREAKKARMNILPPSASPVAPQIKPPKKQQA
ncbi:MAG: hypothetical protein IPM64_17390 [Phycisphaerales bacterium]|nr:hypothetical protein [Phycisphaerales bacterium]